MPAAPQSAAVEIQELRAQILQLEQDVVSAALATNDEQVDALREVCGNCNSTSACSTLVPSLSDYIRIVCMTPVGLNMLMACQPVVLPSLTKQLLLAHHTCRAGGGKVAGTAQCRCSGTGSKPRRGV